MERPGLAALTSTKSHHEELSMITLRRLLLRSTTFIACLSLFGFLAVPLMRPASTAFEPSVAHAMRVIGTGPHGRELISPALSRADVCPPTDKKYWTFIHGQHPFRIWYQTAAAKVEKPRASTLSLELDSTIWGRLTGLMDVKPLASPLNICLVASLPDGALGDTVGNGGCDRVDAYIDMLGSLSNKDGRDVLAHEFMHSLQYVLNVRCSGTWWWREATGEWAEDYVYPHDNREQAFAPKYLSTIDDPLPSADTDKQRAYGSYLFPFFLAHWSGPQLVANIWHRAEHATLLTAIDDALPKGWRGAWPQFMLANWNQDPITKYRQWDGQTDGEYQDVKPFPMALQSGNPEEDVGLKFDISPLSARYYTFTFGGNTRTFTFWNGSPSGYSGEADPDARVQAIIDIDGDKRVEDWTGQEGEAFCLSHPGEQIESVTLIFSNASPTKKIVMSESGIDLAGVGVTDNGCKSWSGSIHGVAKSTSDSMGNVKMNFDWNGIKASAPFPSKCCAVNSAYMLDSGSLDWKVSGVDQEGCKWTGGGTVTPPHPWSLFEMLWRNAAYVSGSLSKIQFQSMDPGPPWKQWDPTVTLKVTCPQSSSSDSRTVSYYMPSPQTVPECLGKNDMGWQVNALSFKGSCKTTDMGDLTFPNRSWTWSMSSSG